MNYKRIKEICIKLEENHCFYRHPKSDFVKVLGQSTVNELIYKGWLKDSPKLKHYWNDYREDCYEFGLFFRRLYNFIVTPTWLWIKIYVLQLWRVRCWWQKIRIACGHHYAWQEYEGVDLSEI